MLPAGKVSCTSFRMAGPPSVAEARARGGAGVSCGAICGDEIPPPACSRPPPAWAHARHDQGMSCAREKLWMSTESVEESCVGQPHGGFENR